MGKMWYNEVNTFESGVKGLELNRILGHIRSVEIPTGASIEQIRHEEGDGLYQVWKIDTPDGRYILKEAKGNEAQHLTELQSLCSTSVPMLYETISIDEKTYLLMEYIAGEDLCKSERKKLILALDALIALQQNTWDGQMLAGSFERSLMRRKDRGNYLGDPLLEKAYEGFLEVYLSIPRALCHDDLLPFNVLVTDKRAVMIDWEVAGMLPYPTAFARFIAHTEEDANALFFMTEADKQFAIHYYYDRLLKDKGIAYAEWVRVLDYFLLYEFCEWVFVGNKYQATDGLYYQKYLPLAKKQAAKLMETAEATPSAREEQK